MKGKEEGYGYAKFSQKGSRDATEENDGTSVSMFLLPETTPSSSSTAPPLLPRQKTQKYLMNQPLTRPTGTHWLDQWECNSVTESESGAQSEESEEEEEGEGDGGSAAPSSTPSHLFLEKSR